MPSQGVANVVAMQEIIRDRDEKMLQSGLKLLGRSLSKSWLLGKQCPAGYVSVLGHHGTVACGDRIKTCPVWEQCKALHELK